MNTIFSENEWEPTIILDRQIAEPLYIYQSDIQKCYSATNFILEIVAERFNKTRIPYVCIQPGYSPPPKFRRFIHDRNDSQDTSEHNIQPTKEQDKVIDNKTNQEPREIQQIADYSIIIYSFIAVITILIAFALVMKIKSTVGKRRKQNIKKQGIQSSEVNSSTDHEMKSKKPIQIFEQSKVQDSFSQQERPDQHLNNPEK